MENRFYANAMARSRMMVFVLLLFTLHATNGQPIRNLVAAQQKDAVKVSFDLTRSGRVELMFKDAGAEFMPVGIVRNFGVGHKDLVWVPSEGFYTSHGIFRIRWSLPSDFGYGIGISKEVYIGQQLWLGVNLNVTRFANGDLIQEAKTAEEWKAALNAGKPAWCYYENAPANGFRYGKLYNWYAVSDPRNVCPNGWHVPSDLEWSLLTEHLGKNTGIKLKSVAGWLDRISNQQMAKSLMDYIATYENGEWTTWEDLESKFPEFGAFNSELKLKLRDYVADYNSGKFATWEILNARFPEFFTDRPPKWKNNSIGNDSTNFGGLPGGMRSSKGSFYLTGYFGYWWVSDVSGSSSFNSRRLDFNNREMVKDPEWGGGAGLSVRCLRD